MGWSRIGLAVVIACVGCGGTNGGGTQGSVVAAKNDAGSSVDASASDQGEVTQDAGPMSGQVREAGVDAIAAVTWTAIYQNLLINQRNPSNCTGSSCHDPGTQKGLDLSSSQMGYETISRRLVPRSPDASDLVTVLQSGYMPLGRPQMPASDIDLIRAWIQTGALDD